MKLGFYSSALDIAGGGEKYFLTIVEEAVRQRYGDIILMSATRPAPRDWRRLGITLPAESFTWRPTSDRTAIRGTSDLDLFVGMRETLPLAHARRSVALIQFPYRRMLPSESSRRPRDLGRRVKDARDRAIMARYDLVVCNSAFTRRYVAAYFDRHDAIVIYPPVDSAVGVIGPKEHVILGVGRFFSMKRHDVLIEGFRNLLPQLPASAGWELHLAGGTDTTRTPYLRALRSQAAGLPVVFHPNVSLSTLQSLYRRASIFWHSAGFGSEDRPRLQEHFGITTVEAMNYECVPVVIALGGQTEIVSHEIDGLLWRSVNELVDQTTRLIKSPDLLARLSRAAAQRGHQFTTERFRKLVNDAILSPAGSARP